jgi:hypothetical protein
VENASLASKSYIEHLMSRQPIKKLTLQLKFDSVIILRIGDAVAADRRGKSWLIRR